MSAASRYDAIGGRRPARDGLVPEDGLKAYARDSWPQALGWSAERLATHIPAAVLLPEREEIMAAALSWAAERGVAVVPRGAGSGVLGAAVPVREGSVVLDASRLRGFELRADAPEPVVRVGAGWSGGELERRLGSLGWSLMHFPQSLEDSSVGGWIATDAWGQLSTRYGGVRAQIRGVRVAGLDGLIRAEDAGPHLGAEGTLGAVVEATLRVRPAPASRRYYSREFPALEPALDWAREAMARGGPPSVLRLYGPVDAFFNGLKRSGGLSGAGPWRSRVETLLLKRTDWLNALTPLLGHAWIAVAIYEDEEPYRDAAPPRAPGAVDLGESPARRWWQRRYHLSKQRLERTFAAGGFVDTADFRAPLSLMPRLDAAVRAALRPHALAFSHLSHFEAGGDACLSVTFAGLGGGERHARAWAAALEAGAAAGARVNHHHGIGLGKLAWAGNAWGEARLAAWRAEKHARDPFGLLNPGKICP
ncbi:MAG: FAD-binding oxidoreductase [Elusimicrobia bacterium]|nr:FAD-binding oxidoreductase [Elusimicrobiota bacterium]